MPARSARDEVGAILHESADVDRRYAVDVFRGIDRVEHLLHRGGAKPIGQRGLNQYAVDRRIQR